MLPKTEENLFSSTVNLWLMAKTTRMTVYNGLQKVVEQPSGILQQLRKSVVCVRVYDLDGACNFSVVCSRLGVRSFCVKSLFQL